MGVSDMRIVHPLSFCLMVVVWLITAWLAFTINAIHILGLLLNLGLIFGLRWLALREGRKSL